MARRSSVTHVTGKGSEEGRRTRLKESSKVISKKGSSTSLEKGKVKKLNGDTKPDTSTNKRKSTGKRKSAADEVDEDDEDDEDDFSKIGGNLELDDEEVRQDNEDEEEEDSEEIEPFPELHDSDEDEDEDEDDLSMSEKEDDDSSIGEDDEDDDYEKQMLAELAQEEALEQELAADDEENSTDDEDLGEGPEALDRLIQRYTVRPNDELSQDQQDKQTNASQQAEKSRLLGFDTRDFAAKATNQISEITGEPKFVWDDIQPGYDSDDSQTEEPNRIGNVPLHFYDDMPHIGYDIDGKRVLRPAKKDELDRFLSNLDDDAWKSVEDKNTGQQVKLSDQELDIIRRLTEGTNPDENIDPYAPQIEIFTRKGQEMVTPLSARPEPKSRFLPSVWEHKKIMKIVKAIREGRIVPNKRIEEKSRFYALWSDNDVARADHPMHMPAPKLKLPTHAESYNPPAEYLFNKEEEKEWNEADPSDRKLDYMPHKYGALRQVPAYKDFVQERFNRLLDLYLAPRMRRRRPRLDINAPEDLLPKLPSPSDLRPFPTHCSITYVQPNNSRTRCVSIDPTGKWAVTGSDDGVVRLWELITGFCLDSWDIGHRKNKEGSPVYSVHWSPNSEKRLFAATINGSVVVITPLKIVSETTAEQLKSLANEAASSSTSSSSSSVPQVTWTRTKIGSEDNDQGILVDIDVPGTPKQVTWHRRGDYFSSVATDAGGAAAVLIHQWSKLHTQAPFKRNKGLVQRVSFHPIKPQLFVATQRYVRIYDLQEQALVKTLNPGHKWISSMDIHPNGEHTVIGGYDKKLAWHDLDLSDSPYKTLRYHQRAIRHTSFHTRKPLFLTTSDDGTIQIFHATVYSDLVTNPLIVPLKVLKGHGVKDGLGVLEASWHPREPWVISVGADGVGRLWCN